MNEKLSKLTSHPKIVRFLAFLALSANKIEPPNDFEDLLKDDTVSEFIELLHNKSAALRKPKLDIPGYNELPDV